MAGLARIDRAPLLAFAVGLASAFAAAGVALTLWTRPETAALSFGAVVLSFLAGHRCQDEQRSIALAFAVLPAAGGWIALLLPEVPGLCLLIAAYMIEGQLEAASASRRWSATRMLLIAAAVVGLTAWLLFVLI